MNKPTRLSFRQTCDLVSIYSVFYMKCCSTLCLDVQQNLCNRLDLKKANPFWCYTLTVMREKTILPGHISCPFGLAHRYCSRLKGIFRVGVGTINANTASTFYPARKGPHRSTEPKMLQSIFVQPFRSLWTWKDLHDMRIFFSNKNHPYHRVRMWGSRRKKL